MLPAAMKRAFLALLAAGGGATIFFSAVLKAIAQFAMVGSDGGLFGQRGAALSTMGHA